VTIFGTLVGAALILIFLIDAFETVLQTQRVTHRYRFARLYYQNAWRIWTFLALRFRPGKRREALLGVFGPLSLLCLFATWVCGLLVGFAIIQCSLGSAIQTNDPRITFGTYLYMSGTTIFTLGYGDVTPLSSLGRILAVVESGMGFAFLAIIVSYLPVLSTAFSKREVTISLMDARAGSPPSASQFLIRLSRAGRIEEGKSILIEWEQWAAELLESHLSFPVLGFYRSQHDNQSWLAALTCMLDSCAVIMASAVDWNPYRAQLTFAMARHAAVDLSLILRTRPEFENPQRLPAEKQAQLFQGLRAAGMQLPDEKVFADKLTELRGMYEPFVHGLARRFLLTLPPIIYHGEVIDNWQRSPGMKRAPELGQLPSSRALDEHFG